MGGNLALQITQEGGGKRAEGGWREMPGLRWKVDGLVGVGCGKVLIGKENSGGG